MTKRTNRSARRFLIAFAIFAACGALAPNVRAQSIVQHKGATTSSSATSLVISFSSNVTAGNGLVYITGGYDANTLGAPTDGNSNTIVKAVNCNDSGQACNGGGSGNCNIYYVASANAGATTVTFHQTTSAALFGWIAEINKFGSSPLDQIGSQLSATASVSTSSADGNASDLVVAFGQDVSNDRTLTAGSGYSGDLIGNAGDGSSGFGEFKFVSATGVQTATWGGNSGDTMAQCIATLKAVSGGGGGGCAPTLTLLGFGKCG